ncbi:hypothetical protein [Streptomyces sp. NPDC087300]|uniref:hypothetical protein n=1 Tax=Streptomyces sp. NPDC087300 TaxID=3365780 RepID=UPI00380D45EB
MSSPQFGADGAVSGVGTRPMLRGDSWRPGLFGRGIDFREHSQSIQLSDRSNVIEEELIAWGDEMKLRGGR